MRIRPIDNVVTVVEHPPHDEHERRPKHPHAAKKEKIPSAPVYKSDGELEEALPPKIDVLV